MAENSSILDFDDIIRRTDVFQVLFANFDELESRINSLAKQLRKDIQLTNPNDTKTLQKQATEVAKLENALKRLQDERGKAQTARKKSIALTNEELVALQKEKAANRERNAIAKQTAIIQKEGAESIAGIRAQLSLVTIQWKKLTEEETRNTKQGKQLVATKLALTKRLKAVEKATDDNRRSVGKYENALGGLGKTAARVFIGRTLVDGLRRLSTFLGGVIEKNKDTNEGLQQLSGNLGRASGSIENAASKLLVKLAPAINLVLSGFISLVDFLAGGNDEIKEFAATSGELEGQISDLEKGFKKEAAAANQAFSALSDLKKPTGERKKIIGQINEQYGKYLPNLLTEKSSLEEIAKAQDLVNQALNTTFLLRIQQETQTDIFINKTRQTIDAFNLLREAANRSGNEISSSYIGAFGKLSEAIAKGRVTTEELKGEFNRFNFSDTVFSESIKDLGGDVEEFVVALRDSFRGADRDEIAAIFRKLGADTRGYNEAIKGTQTAISSLQGELKTFTRGEGKDVAKLTSERLAAIEQLIRDVEKLETQNIKDKEERLLALEELRFKEQARLTEERLKELQKASKGNQEELATIEKEGQNLREQQLIEHEQNKIDIANQFAEKRAQEAQKTVEQVQDLVKKDQEQQEKLITESISQSQKAIQKAEQLAQKERKKTRQQEKDDIKQVLKDINTLSQQVNKEIQQIFSQRVELTNKAAEEQLTAVERAEERARAGLTNNLKFEQEQLAKRRAEQQRAIKEQKQAADALALTQLVIAQAQNGEKDAVGKAIIQFGILKGFEAAIRGSFFEGTEDTGTGGHWDSKKGFLSILHPHERVIAAKENKELKGISNQDIPMLVNLGRDFLEGNLSLDASHFRQQIKDVSTSDFAIQDNSEVVRQLEEVKKSIQSIPVIDYRLEELYGQMLEITKISAKKHFTKEEKIRKRL